MINPPGPTCCVTVTVVVVVGGGVVVVPTDAPPHPASTIIAPSTVITLFMAKASIYARASSTSVSPPAIEIDARQRPLAPTDGSCCDSTHDSKLLAYTARLFLRVRRRRRRRRS